MFQLWCFLYYPMLAHRWFFIDSVTFIENQDYLTDLSGMLINVFQHILDIYLGLFVWIEAFHVNNDQQNMSIWVVVFPDFDYWWANLKADDLHLLLKDERTNIQLNFSQGVIKAFSVFSISSQFLYDGRLSGFLEAHDNHIEDRESLLLCSKGWGTTESHLTLTIDIRIWRGIIK